MRALRILAVALASAGLHAAQVLPFRTFGPREGLPHERVSALFEDSRGFLWIGTWDGLARFDGASFTTYGAREGLPSTVAFALAEDARGDVWFGAHTAGIARLAFARAVPAGAPRVEVFSLGAEPAANAIEAIVFLGEHAWIATGAGLHAMTLDAAGRPRFELRWESPQPWSVQAVVRRDERAWILAPRATIALAGSDFTVAPGPGEDPGFDVRAEPAADGRVLLCTAAGVVEFTPPDRFAPVAFETPAGGRVKATAFAPDGTRWIGTSRGLFRLGSGGVERLGREAGLPSESISAVLVDRAGRPWIGTHDGGLAVLAAASPINVLLNGARTGISRLVRGVDGRLYGASAAAGICAVDAHGLTLLPGSTAPPVERTEGFFHRDRTGAFWLGSAGGLFRARGPALAFDALDGPHVPGPCAGQVHEDAHGSLWVSAAPHTVYARAPGGAFEPVLEWPDSGDAVREVHLDRAERLWLVGWRALWRRSGGVQEEIRVAGEPPQARALLEDRAGRLWLGLRHGGLAWTDEPGAATPRFERMRAADGLPSDTVWALAEGADGALWIGTGRGLARLTPDVDAGVGARPGRLDTWTSADGLAGAVFHVLCAEDGRVWAATAGGVALVDPRDRPAARPRPTVFVEAFEAGGELHALPEAGAAEVAGIVLAPGKDGVSVRFGGVDLLHGDELRFQTRLGGAEWSAPSRERSLHLARLEPGDYDLEVRAVGRDGLTSAASARVGFRLLAPVWRRPWFVALAALALGLAIVALHRARMNRLVAVERVRAEIAGDLHDEVGAGLAQISILSEVARRAAGPAVAAQLGEVAELARTTRASLGDLVWAIHPEKDRLEELVARMQGASGQVLEPAGVELSFRAPGAAELARVALGPEARRQLLLFFKEALTNAARHARAGRVDVALTLDGERLRLAIEDDGCGFDPRATSSGLGLASLRRRAARLGGSFELDSERGRGTRVALSVPLAR